MKKGIKKETCRKNGPKAKTESVHKKIPWQEVIGLFLLAMGFFVMFCLVNPAISGNIGIKIGFFLLKLMGWGSFSISLLMIMLSVWYFHPFKPSVFIFSSILLASIIWIVEITRCLLTGNGGLWGIYLNGILVKNLGFVGTLIFLIVLFLITSILLSGFRIKDLAGFTLRVFGVMVFVARSGLQIHRVVRQRVRVLFTPIAKAIEKTWERKRIAKRTEEEIIDDLREASRIAENLNLEKIDMIIERSSKKRGEVKAQTQEKSKVQYNDSEEHIYKLPSLSMLENFDNNKNKKGGIRDLSSILIDTLGSFGVSADVINIERGPSVTRYELQPAKGVRVSKISNLQNDLALVLAAPIRIEAPVPGKACVGIEVPNERIDIVHVKEILQSDEFKSKDHILPIAIGKDITGKPIIGDLVKMPHLLVAGATGSGKSVCVNCIIASLLFTMYPTEVQLVMIDPKVVELSMYEGIPHHMDIKSSKDDGIITEPKIATLALQRLTEIMDERYHEFKAHRARNIFEYNKKAPLPIPYIVIIIDELADLMMVSSAQVEKHICRIAQKGRAAGIHLIVATQRPSVNVITGVIKANIPSRIAFAVAQQVDSRTILDRVGAEKLLGKGDMLYHASGTAEPRRVQGAYISSEDIENIVTFWQEQPPPENLISIDVESKEDTTFEDVDSAEEGEDELFPEAVRIIHAERQASVSLLQRKMKIGYARAGRIIDQMERKGIVGPANGSKSRAIIGKSGDGTGD